LPKNNIVDLKPTNRGNYMSEKTDKKSEKSNSEECKGHCHDSDESCKNESKKQESTKAAEPKKVSKMDKSELLDLLQHTQANFENFKKQNDEHFKSAIKFANKRLLTELLPTLDSFEMALRGSDNATGELKNFLVGMKMVLDQFVKTLASNKVHKIAQLKTFDPKLHEAMEKLVSEKPEDTILEVVQSGYMIGDKVIRAARVKVSSGNKE
jgi:molecular chaperone GrpE